MTLRIDGKMLGILMVSMLTAACGAAPDGEPAEATEGTGAVKLEPAEPEPAAPVAPTTDPTTHTVRERTPAGANGHINCVIKCPIQCDPSQPNCAGGSGDEHTQE